MPGSMPGPGLSTGRSQDPFADRYDQPSLLGQRNKFCWSNKATFWVPPAHESFCTCDHAVLERRNRLEIKLELFPLGGPSQVRLQLQARHCAGTHTNVKPFITRLAPRLGTMHRHVRIVQDVLGSLTRCPFQGDSNAGGKKHLLPTKVERCRQYFLDALGHSCGVADALHIVQENRELVSCKTRDRGSRA